VTLPQGQPWAPVGFGNRARVRAGREQTGGRLTVIEWDERSHPRGRRISVAGGVGAGYARQTSGSFPKHHRESSGREADPP
jgi:hypothetical protein